MDARLTGIDRREALIYMGWKGGSLPPELETDLGRCEAALMEAARPRLVWRRFPLNGKGVPEGTDFRPQGEDVKRLLTGCTAVVFFAATLGMEAERLIRRAQAVNMADALILDACGSAAIENVCDNFCADLARREAPAFLTDRFSPGYGDLPLSQQPEFCRLLDVGRRIGVTLSPAGLMTPQKSVTALLGVSPVPVKKRGRRCEDCAGRAGCPYQKEGLFCENE